MPAKQEEIWESAWGLRFSSQYILELSHVVARPELNVASRSLTG